MSVEIQKKQCKQCLEYKDRIAFGKFPDGRNKRWVDTDGKSWNGLLCPDCHKKRTVVNMHKCRSKVVLPNE